MSCTPMLTRATMFWTFVTGMPMHSLFSESPMSVASGLMSPSVPPLPNACAEWLPFAVPVLRPSPTAMACGAAAAEIPTRDAATATLAIILFISKPLQEMNSHDEGSPVRNNPAQPGKLRIITRTDRHSSVLPEMPLFRVGFRQHVPGTILPAPPDSERTRLTAWSPPWTRCA